MKQILLLIITIVFYICGTTFVFGQNKQGKEVIAYGRDIIWHEKKSCIDTFDFYFDNQAVKITFLQWDMDCKGDFLYVFDSGNLKSSFGCNRPLKNEILSNRSSGLLRLVFISDDLNFNGSVVFRSELIPLSDQEQISLRLNKNDVNTIMADHCDPCTGYINASADQPLICKGNCTFLNVDARLFTSINDNFNNGLNNDLWEFTNGTLTQGCGSPDGTPTMWFGSGVPERFASTKNLNTEGACNLSFKFKFGMEVDPKDDGCEDADEAAENVRIQFFNGLDWITFHTLDNNGLIPNGPFDDWTQICLDIPIDAQQPTTRFRWIQPAHSGFGFDQWAIDDVSIDVNLIPKYQWQGPHFMGNNSDTLKRPPVCPSSTATYTVTAFNGNQSLQTTVTLEVVDTDQLGGIVIADETIVCPNQRPKVLTLTGYQGNIVAWQYSTGCTGNYLPIVNTSPNYAPPPISETTCYRALIQFGPCNAVSDSIIMQVPTSQTGTVTVDKDTICMGELATYTVSNHLGEVAYWEYGNSPSMMSNILPIASNSVTVNGNDFNCFRAMIRYPGCPDSTARPSAHVCLEFVNRPIIRGIRLLEPWFDEPCGDSVYAVTSFNILPENVIAWVKKPYDGDWQEIPNSANQTTLVFDQAVKEGDCFRMITDVSDTACFSPIQEFCVKKYPCDSGCVLTGGEYCYNDLITENIFVAGNGECKKVAQFEVAENPHDYECLDPRLHYVVQPDSLNLDSIAFKAQGRRLTVPLCIRALAVMNYDPLDMQYLYYGFISMLRTPSAPTSVSATPNSVCAGNNNGLVVVGDFEDFLEIYQWNIKPSEKDTAWTEINTGSTNLTYTNLTVSTTYRVKFRDKIHGCVFTSDSTVVEVIPATAGGDLEGGRNVCPDNTAAFLSLKNYSGVPVRWETSINDCNGPWSLFTTSPITDYVTHRLTRTTCYRVILKSGNCPEAISTPALVNIVPPPLGGEISGSSAICLGQQGPRLSLDNNTGFVVRWESSTDCANFTNPVTIANTNTFYDVPAVQQNTCYRVVVSNGGCESVSQTGLVSVVPQTLPGKLSGIDRVCFGGNSDIRLSESTGDIVRWERKPNSSPSWTTINHTLNQYNTGPLFETTCYRVFVKSPSCPESATAPFCVRVDSLPEGGTLTPDTTVCVGQPVGNIKLVNYRGGVIQWERSTGCTGNWSVIPNSGFPEFNPGLINQNTCYRVQVMVIDCGTAYSDVHEVKVAQPSVGGGLSSSQTICAGAPSDLMTLTGHVGIVIGWDFRPLNGTWQTIPNTQNRTTYTAPVLNTTTEFRVRVQNMSCSEAFSSTVTINVVVPQPVGSLAPSSTVCEGSPGTTITLTGNNGNIIRWEQAFDCNNNWTTINNITNTLATGMLNRTICYRAVVNGGTCPEGYTEPLIIDVEPRPSGGELIGTKEICDNSTEVTFRLINHTGEVQKWQQSYDLNNWTDIDHKADSLKVVVNQPTYYRVVVGRGICPIAMSDTAMVKLAIPPVGGRVISDQTICLGQRTQSMELRDFTGNVIRWEVSKDLGLTWVSIGKAGFTSYDPGRLTITTWFRVIINNDNCIEVASEPVKITVNRPAQRGYLIGGGSFCTPSLMPTLTLMQYVGNIEHWEESTDNGLNWTIIQHNQPTYTPPAFFGTKTFRVRIGMSGCESVYSLSANVLISAQTVGGEVLPNTTICLGMRSPRFSLWNFTGEVLRWEVSKDSIHWTSLGKKGFTWYQPGTLTITTWFRAIIQNGTCSEAVSKPVRITVIRRPTETQDGGSITGTDSVCLGASVSITLTGNQAPISHWEYTDGGWVNAIRIDDGSPTINLTQTAVTDRRYRAVLTNPCGQISSKEFTVKALLPPTLNATVEGSCDAGGTIRAQSSEPNTLFSLIPNVQPPNQTGIFEQLPYGNYTLSGTNVNGCSHFIPVEVRPTAPDPPKITQVLNISPTISRVHWTRVRGNSISYILRYKIQNTNNWTTIGTIVDTFKVIQPLEPTTYYELQVAAVCRMPDGLTDTTAWSDGIIKGFQTSGTPLDCAPPLPLPPFPSGIYIDEITPTGAKVHWNRVLNTAGYIVSFGLVQQNPQTWMQNMVCAPDTFLILQNLLPNNHYRVRVRTNCTNCTTAIQIRDRRSNWSETYGFDTPNPRLGEDVETFFDVKLYPNPANQDVSIYYTVPIEECATMEAFTATGARIAEWKLKGGRGQITLDTKAWSEGVYLFRFNCNGQIYTHKLIISR